ncbi:diguanylate cyclase domain-containing protein [Acetobacterium sp.]|uniref:diguanylate cyclase domain-containing protein n=1 Tax=Acetobacterium sp. TaxID=1872094 RepID=UPI003593182F
MNILSLLSFTIFILFVLLGIYCLRSNKRQPLNQFAFIECLMLSVWAFAYTFFYTAPNLGAAMYWHRFGCIGGSLFPPFAVYFFIILSNREHYLSRFELKILFYAIPVAILIKNLTGDATCLASGFTQSTSGLGWTYINSIENVWSWIYVLYLGIYFSIGFYLLLQWRNESSYQIQRKQALAIIVIDAIVLIFGVSTDVLLPMVTIFLPPLANLGTALFAVGFFYLISDHQLFSFSTTASSDVILDTVMDPVLLLDEKGTILRYNLATCLTLKYNETQLLGKDLNMLLLSQQYNRDNLELLHAHQKIESRETDLITADGKTIHAILSAAVASDSMDGFMGIVVTFHDITLRKITELELLQSRENYKQLADELYLLANYDTLTHLPNRRMFFSRLKDLSNQYPASAHDFSVIFLDLNEFKIINDNYGHDVGDQVLVEAAKRLEKSKTGDEFLSRIGGDEFTIIIPDVKSEDAIRNRVREIKADFNQPVKLNELIADLSISAGYALFSTAEDNIDTLVHNADLKMYEDKRRSHESANLFQSSFNHDSDHFRR